MSMLLPHHHTPALHPLCHCRNANRTPAAFVVLLNLPHQLPLQNLTTVYESTIAMFKRSYSKSSSAVPTARLANRKKKHWLHYPHHPHPRRRRSLNPLALHFFRFFKLIDSRLHSDPKAPVSPSWSQRSQSPSPLAGGRLFDWFSSPKATTDSPSSLRTVHDSHQTLPHGPPSARESLESRQAVCTHHEFFGLHCDEFGYWDTSQRDPCVQPRQRTEKEIEAADAALQVLAEVQSMVEAFQGPTVVVPSPPIGSSPMARPAMARKKHSKK